MKQLKNVFEWRGHALVNQDKSEGARLWIVHVKHYICKGKIYLQENLKNL